MSKTPSRVKPDCALVSDFAIVGAGPNGLSAASELRSFFPNKQTVVIEQGGIGHHISQYPDVQWHSVMSGLKLGSALDEVIPDNYLPTSSEFHLYLENFAEEQNISILKNSRVSDISPSGDGRLTIFFQNANGANTLTARYVILATGIFENCLPIQPSNLKVRRRLDINIRNKRIAIIGGGASAIDAVRYLLPENRIYWIVRGGQEPEPWKEIRAAYEEIRHKFPQNLSIFLNNEIVEANGRTLSLSGGGFLEDIDEIFALIGYSATGKFVHDLGLETSQGLLKLDENLQTEVKNLFAFGAMATRFDSATGRMRQSFVDRGNKDSLSLIIRAIKLDMVSRFISSESIVDIERPPVDKSRIVAAIYFVLRPLIIVRRRLLARIREVRRALKDLVEEIAES